MSRNDESAPEAQKKCHGSRTPKLSAWAFRRRSAGAIVVKIPAKSTATSTIGPNPKAFAARRRGAVLTHAPAASAAISASCTPKGHGASAAPSPRPDA